jgi:hypothetical protein
MAPRVRQLTTSQYRIERVRHHLVFGRWYWNIDTEAHLVTRLRGSDKHILGDGDFSTTRRGAIRAINRRVREHERGRCVCNQAVVIREQLVQRRRV